MLLTVSRCSSYLIAIFLLAELTIIADDLSENISITGMDASGTSKMKFAMNGGLIIGTMDGANIEILEETDNNNRFTFGLLNTGINSAGS